MEAGYAEGIAMKDDLTSKLLLILAGTIAGVLSGAVGAYFKALLDRRSEVEKSDDAVRLQFLYPLLVIATEFQARFENAFKQVQKEKDDPRPEDQMTDRYYLRYWFWRCKEFVVNSDSGWTAETRKRELAMNSGGVGSDAVSTLYVTAAYLWHATRIRLHIPSEMKGRGIELSQRLHEVRNSLAAIEFYDVTQDSTGVSVTGAKGDVMNYREFCEAMTSEAERAWFLTLTDVYFKLRFKSENETRYVFESLARLTVLLQEILKINRREMLHR
jgi:hypothetical protein